MQENGTQSNDWAAASRRRGRINIGPGIENRDAGDDGGAKSESTPTDKEAQTKPTLTRCPSSSFAEALQTLLTAREWSILHAIQFFPTDARVLHKNRQAFAAIEISKQRIGNVEVVGVFHRDSLQACRCVLGNIWGIRNFRFNSDILASYHGCPRL